MTFRKFLFQRTVMPYSATPPKPRHDALVEPLVDFRDVVDRAGRGRVAMRVHARDIGGQRLDLEAVDRDDGVAVVHQMMREREARRAEADHENLLARRRARRTGARS